MKRFLLLLAVLGLVCTGCNHLPRADAPQECQVFDRYDKVQLGCTTTSDVLINIKNVDLKEKLSQGENVIASWGQKGDYGVLWLNLVAFDEDTMNAKRKYSLLVDEDSPGYGCFLLQPSKNVRLDASMILDDGTLSEPFTDEKARKIAVIKKLKQLFAEDMSQVTSDSHSVKSTAMFVNGALNYLLGQLERTPAMAGELENIAGMEFDHEHFGKGKMRIIICEDPDEVKVKIKIGTYSKDFENHKDVINM